MTTADPPAAARARGPETSPVPLLVVMGVSGSGKTTVGLALSERLGLPFADADDFHSPASVAKMAAGIALEDADRLPWLREVGRWLAAREDTGAVVSCSALRRLYRDVLREAAPGAFFVHLHGDAEVVRRRVAGRPGHFMPASLVGSQYAALEPLEAGENGVVLDFSRPVDRLVEDYLAVTGATPPGESETSGT
jgi:gluconokinase